MFGIVIGCCWSDWHYAVGTYASIRYYLGEIPICFLYHGAVVPRVLATLPGTQMLTREMVSNPELRRRSFGPGLTKMVAIWESPFEEFLYLDADTVICGDIVSLAGFDSNDALVDRRHSYDDEAIAQWFFDTRRIELLFPDFDYRKHREHYFCTGTFFARKGLLKVEQYLELLTMSEREPGLFKFWEMGLLNLMLFRDADLGRIRVKGIAYQLVTPDHSSSELEVLFASSLLESLRAKNAPAVFHFVVHKPHLFQNKAFTLPMRFFRLKFWACYGGFPRPVAWSICLCQDIRFYWLRKVRHRLWLVKKWLERNVWGRFFVLVS